MFFSSTESSTVKVLSSSSTSTRRNRPPTPGLGVRLHSSNPIHHSRSKLDLVAHTGLWSTLKAVHMADHSNNFDDDVFEPRGEDRPDAGAGGRGAPCRVWTPRRRVRGRTRGAIKSPSCFALLPKIPCSGLSSLPARRHTLAQTDPSSHLRSRCFALTPSQSLNASQTLSVP